MYCIPSIDILSVRRRKAFDDMRGQPNISACAKFLRIFSVYIGMETLALLSLELSWA